MSLINWFHIYAMYILCYVYLMLTWFINHNNIAVIQMHMHNNNYVINRNVACTLLLSRPWSMYVHIYVCIGVHMYIHGHAQRGKGRRTYL
jgi:hypothetical protein